MKRGQRKSTKAPKLSQWRHILVVGVFGLCVLGMCGRVLYLGVTEREFLQQQGDARSIRRESIPAMRGVIYDRHGAALAVSTPVFGIWTDPSRARFTANDVAQLAATLEVEAGTLRERIATQQEKEFVYLSRRSSWETAERVRALGLDHVYFQPEYRRFYPAAETASHIVGVTDINDSGAEGIEYSFDDELQGAHGGKVVLKDRRGNTVRDLEYLGAPEYGNDLNLTIDLRLQYIAYRELKSAVAVHKAKSGSLIMVDAGSGDVLALVNQPSYNPNDIPSQLRGMRNRAVTDAYEPGSTIKPFTALAALETGRYSAGTTIDTDPGYFRIGSKLIEDPVNRGQLTLMDAIAKSSQVAIAKVAMDLEERAVFDVLRRAGVGDYLGTGLPGESIGFMDDTQLRYPVVRATLAYGYGLSVTPLQLAQAYLTLAKLGEKTPLSIVRSSRQRAANERVFDRRLVREVLTMMERVTDADGTAPGAAVAGYRVAGKTGTARIVGPQGYDDKRHVAWFAGMVPVTAPRFVMVVVVNEPQSGLSGGGAVAAPIFARVARKSLVLLGVAPDQQIASADAGKGNSS